MSYQTCRPLRETKHELTWPTMRSIQQYHTLSVEKRSPPHPPVREICICIYIPRLSMTSPETVRPEEKKHTPFTKSFEKVAAAAAAAAAATPSISCLCLLSLSGHFFIFRGFIWDKKLAGWAVEYVSQSVGIEQTVQTRRQSPSSPGCKFSSLSPSHLLVVVVVIISLFLSLSRSISLSLPPSLHSFRELRANVDRQKSCRLRK